MEYLKQTIDPLINAIPPSLKDWWFMIVCVVALIILLPVAWYQRRLIHVLVTGGRGAKPRFREPLAEDLAAYAPSTASAIVLTSQLAAEDNVPRRLLLEGVPVGLRLVVVAPLGMNATIDEQHVDELLNLAVWGLGSLARQEEAQIKIWPPQLSAHGFAAVFHRMVHRPEAEGEPSNWILLAGHTPPRPRPSLIGLACWTEEKTTIGRVVVQPNEWTNWLRIERAASPAAVPTPAAVAVPGGNHEQPGLAPVAEASAEPIVTYTGISAAPLGHTELTVESPPALSPAPAETVTSTSPEPSPEPPGIA
jgi:hypothetical protein